MLGRFYTKSARADAIELLDYSEKFEHEKLFVSPPSDSSPPLRPAVQVQEEMCENARAT